MESTFLRLQQIVNQYTSYRLKKAINLFGLKSEYWNKETLHTHIEEEIYNSSLELIELHEKHPILHIITNFSDLKNVLWESTFIESLSPDERKKYGNSEQLSLSFEQLKNDNTIYDEQIPYFSGILSSIYLTKYIAYLQSQLPQEQPAQVLSALETKSTFEAGFTLPQIKLLTQCVNEARIFTESITTETFENILSCTLARPLKSRNNRLLVYFFSALDDRSLINRNWQAVIDKNRLFLSSGKNNPLTQTDLSSAKTELKDSSPKGSEIIDKYLKELKNH
ncbi:hypothetical protein KCV26_06670 [Petrimonas sulfuriphila]|jgi:hypothetical protein|uniref:hypothetical protein n=1 Tax=Petrimonas sulfuriphila TaxID=285070 RepID=UPI000E9B8EBC|nr:hypothetical protein [Porphyromonadaceae bacterium]HBC37330.1 hypothetical protein [Porphyromonadaceae bacterium]HBF95097.1 hypothetical protein [Porphyromonadaceae bacterium]HBK41227.1 hypothetical protein [Porphyromonadaceae bacterium]HBK93409.1 hypothetical protein [Porphyromonadaceae bacterium]